MQWLLQCVCETFFKAHSRGSSLKKGPCDGKTVLSQLNPWGGCCGPATAFRVEVGQDRYTKVTVRQPDKSWSTLLPTSLGTGVWKRGQKAINLPTHWVFSEPSARLQEGTLKTLWTDTPQNSFWNMVGRKDNCLGVVSIQWGKNVSATWNGVQRKPPVGGDNGS